MTNVLIVDDDALVRSGLALIVGGAKDIDVVAQASDGAEGVALVKELKPDVVLMDIRMPVMNGLEATEVMCSLPHRPQIIVLTTFDADEYVVRALSAGASGFLLKDTPPGDIVDAIHKVAAGDPMLSPGVTRQLIRQVTAGHEEGRKQTARTKLSELTEREAEVAGAVGEGLSNADIAAKLFMSIPTVKAHIGRLFSKLGVDNRVQIAILVHDAQINSAS
ncbi:MAG TPA: response regulator transcription factor [Nocardioidaceae bacterium]|nr:response regulator transcription factor [Nocardioidaceae bacterium]